MRGNIVTLVMAFASACTVGDSDPQHVSALGGSDAGSCPTGECDPYTAPPAPSPDGGGSGSGSGSAAALVALDATNGCTQNLPALPSGCIAYRGDAAWLWCYYQSGWPTPVSCMVATGFESSCELSDLTIAVIAADCNTRATTADKILCASDGIRTFIGGGNGTNGNVCRHFSRCFKKVYEAMGFSQSVTTRWLGTSGHAFNIVDSSPSGRYFVDSSNDIMFWCP